jgi:hypothetical protein
VESAVDVVAEAADLASATTLDAPKHGIGAGELRRTGISA